MMKCGDAEDSRVEKINPEWSMQFYQPGKEILRITAEGKVVPAEGLTVQGALLAMVEWLRHDERHKILQILKDCHRNCVPPDRCGVCLAEERISRKT